MIDVTTLKKSSLYYLSASASAHLQVGVDVVIENGDDDQGKQELHAMGEQSVPAHSYNHN